MIGIIGAVAGDILGSYYEHYKNSTKDYNFELFGHWMILTDDTIHTCAIADWLMNTDRSVEACKNKLIEWSKTYGNAGYGPMMKKWIEGVNNYQPYNSFGNGSAMRVSPVMWVTDDIDKCLELARISALPTHNHEEGIKGAQALALAGLMNRLGRTKESIREHLKALTGYNLDRTYDEIHEVHKFDCTCQGSVPEAIICWLESNSYEDCIRKAIALGGDADTLACMAGSICACNKETDVPDQFIKDICYNHCRLDDRIINLLNEFYDKYIKTRYNDKRRID